MWEHVKMIWMQVDSHLYSIQSTLCEVLGHKISESFAAVVLQVFQLYLQNHVHTTWKIISWISFNIFSPFNQCLTIIKSIFHKRGKTWFAYPQRQSLLVTLWTDASRHQTIQYSRPLQHQIVIFIHYCSLKSATK